MRKILICALLGWCSVGFADVDDLPGQGKSGHGPHPKDKTIKEYPATAGQLVGRCTILKGSGNPLTGACSEVLLVLKDGKGKELLRARTEKNGEFLFETTADSGDLYIAPESTLYQLVAPKTASHSGDRVQVKLKQQ